MDRHRHGRREHRRVEVFAVGGRRPPEGREPVARAARIAAPELAQGHPHRGLSRARREVAYDVSRIRLDAASFRPAVRAHRGIENRAHHVRDRLLREDDGRIRRKPVIVARLRSFALTILRADGVTNVSEALDTNALSLDRLLADHLPKS